MGHFGFKFSIAFFVFYFLIFQEPRAQEKNDYEQILVNYQYNRYELVAEQTERYMATHENLSADSLIVLLEINAVCNFALNRTDKARESFFNILKLNENYEPDPKLISPKIIRFFKKVRKDYFLLKEAFLRKEKEREANKKIILKRREFFEQQKSVALGSFLSVLYPGAGHLYLGGANIKSVALTSATTLLLLGGIYSAIKTNELKKDYMNEVDPVLIEEKYSDYNNAYRNRNMIFGAYLAVWVFAQLDFFWFDADELFNGADVSFSFENTDYVTLKFRAKL